MFSFLKWDWGNVEIIIVTGPTHGTNNIYISFLSETFLMA